MQKDGPFPLKFAVEGYLEAQATRFINIFDPNCYLYLSSAIDHFTLQTGRMFTETDILTTKIEGLLNSVDKAKLGDLLLHSDERCQRMLSDLQNAGVAKWMISKPEINLSGTPRFRPEQFRAAVR